MKKCLSIVLAALMLVLCLSACDKKATTAPSGYVVEGVGYVTLAGGERLSTADCLGTVKNVVSTCEPSQSVTSIYTTINGHNLSSSEVFTVFDDNGVRTVKLDYSYEKNAEFVLGSSTGYVYTEVGSKTIPVSQLPNGDRFKLSPSCLTMNDAYYASVLAQNIEASDTITLKLTLNSDSVAAFFGMQVPDISTATVTYVCDNALNSLLSLTVNFTYTTGASMVITANYTY